MYFVLTDASKKESGWDREEFFETGRAEIASLLQRLPVLGLTPERGKVLDFGCGPGRLSQALAQYFAEVWGVDVSSKMIELAHKFNRQGNRCQYVVNSRSDLSLFAPQSFDFIYSRLVLQHIPNRFSLRFVREFMRILKPGGVAVFQLSTYAGAPHLLARLRQRWATIHRRVFHHRHLLYYVLVALGYPPHRLYREHGYRPVMGMNTMDSSKVDAAIEAGRSRIVHVDKQPRRHGRMQATYYVQKIAKATDPEKADEPRTGPAI